MTSSRNTIGLQMKVNSAASAVRPGFALHRLHAALDPGGEQQRHQQVQRQEAEGDRPRPAESRRERQRAPVHQAVVHPGVQPFHVAHVPEERDVLHAAMDDGAPDRGPGRRRRRRRRPPPRRAGRARRCPAPPPPTRRRGRRRRYCRTPRPPNRRPGPSRAYCRTPRPRRPRRLRRWSRTRTPRPPPRRACRSRASESWPMETTELLASSSAGIARCRILGRVLSSSSLPWLDLDAVTSSSCASCLAAVRRGHARRQAGARCGGRAHWPAGTVGRRGGQPGSQGRGRAGVGMILFHVGYRTGSGVTNRVRKAAAPRPKNAAYISSAAPAPP